jgi:DNA-directed RNA polymerase specialized sigma24 family protein
MICPDQYDFYGRIGTIPMDNSSAQAVPRSDADLIRAVASGDAAAYVGLHERHVAAARSLAGLIVADSAEAEQVLSAAFTRLRDAIRLGAGPAEALRPYLLTVVRREARARQDGEPAPAPDVAAQAGYGEPLIIDPLVAELAASPLARAFLALPERWRAALWHEAVEEADPAETAAVLGATADGAAQIAGQARAGLIVECLKRYWSGLDQEACRSAIGQLSAHADGTLSGFDHREVQQHLRDCRQCRAAAFELAELGRSLRRVVAPLILGSAASRYLARAGTGPKAGAKAAPQAGTKTGAKTGPKTGPKTGSKAAPQAGAKAGAKAGSKAGPTARTVPGRPVPEPTVPDRAAAGAGAAAAAGAAAGAAGAGAAAAEADAATSAEATAAETAHGPAVSMAAEAGGGRRRIGQMPRQQRVLAGAGLLLTAFVVAGLALTLATGSGPHGNPRPAAATVPTPPASSPAPSSPAAPSPRHARHHHPPATVSRVVKPTPSPSASPSPSPSASPTPTLPVPTAPVLPSPQPFPTPPHRHHRHPFP